MSTTPADAGPLADPIGVRFVRTMPLILSVTELKS